MKLDFDCVRDVLMKIEALSKYNNNFEYVPLSVYDISNALDEYEIDTIYYTLRKLEDGGYIEALYNTNLPINIGQFYILDITFKGHEYLNTVRDPKIWRIIKSKLIAPTFSLIMQLAPEIIKSYIGI